MEEVYAPCLGTIIDISETSDPVISQKMVGDGMAVVPESGVVCAPVSGQIISIQPANHAFIIQKNENLNLLVHIGIDTVELKGKYLKRLVEKGQVVERGTPIIKANFRKISKKYDPTVIVILLEREISAKTKQKSCRDLDTILFEV